MSTKSYNKFKKVTLWIEKQTVLNPQLKCVVAKLKQKEYIYKQQKNKKKKLHYPSLSHSLRN